MAHVIDAIITLKDNFSTVLGNVNSNMTKFAKQQIAVGKQIEKTGKSIQNVGSTLNKSLTLPVIAAGAGLLKLGYDFEKAEDTIRVGTGATGKALEDLNNDFKMVYGSVPTNMADASSAISDLNTRLGLTGKPLQDLSIQILNVSRITKTDLSTEIQAATRMFQDAGIKQQDYSKALDYTFKVSQSTGIGIDKLQQLMTQFGGPLRQMGFDWQTSAAMLGKFEKEGVNTELVVGSLRIALGKMAQKGITDPSKALQTMITQIKNAGSAGKANALALSMFGAKAGPDMAAAIREGRMDLTSLMTALKNSPETINKAAKDTETFTQKFTEMKNKLAVKLEPIGSELVDSLDKLMPTIENVASSIGDLIQRFANLPQAQQETILKFVLMAAAAGPVVTTFGKVVYGIGEMSVSMGNLIKAVKRSGGIMAWLTSPAHLVVLALIALVAGAVLVATHWGQITAAFDRFKQTLKDNETAIKVVATVLALIFGPALLTAGAQAAITTIKLIAQAAAYLGLNSAMLITKGAMTVVTAAQWLFNAALTANPIAVVIVALAALGAAIYEVVKHWQDICTWVEKAWNWLKTWNGTKPEDKTVKVTSSYLDKYSQPVNHSGYGPSGHNALGTTYWGGGETWVGENGPEKVILPKGSQVKDNRASMKSVRSINIAKLADQIIVREEADIDKISTAIVKKIIMAGDNI